MIRLALWGYTAAALFAWVGFALGHSRNPWLFGYSVSYLLFLVALGMVLAGPWIVVLLSRRVGARWLVSVTAPTLIVVVPLAYLAAASFYYWTQEHRFDPYLQNPGVVIDDIERPRAGDELRVVALGGSTTESSELPEPERYPARLQGLLSDAYVDRPINVVNAGRDWWTTKHSLIHYVTHVRRWRPDVVTVMHAVNDLYRSFASDGYALGEYTASWGHFYGPAIQGARPPTFLGWLLGRTSRLMFLHWYSDWRIREVDYGLDQYRSIPEYEAHLRTLAQVVAADGAALFVLTQGSLYKPEPSADELDAIRFGEEFCMTRTGWLTAEYPSVPSLRRAMDAYNDVARRVASEEGAVLVDLDGRLSRDLNTFIDDVHHTSSGAEQVADAVFEAIQMLPIGGVDANSTRQSTSGPDQKPEPDSAQAGRK